MAISNDTLLDNGSADLGADWTSDPFSLDYATQFCLQLIFTGFPVGTWTLECSNSRELRDAVWSTVPGSDQAITEAGEHTYLIQNCPYKWGRLKWTWTNGTALLTFAQFNTKS